MPKDRDQQVSLLALPKTPEKLAMQVNQKRERSIINQITYHL
jgi:hypothetical protein